MSSGLLNIAASGVRAARAGLDVTSQNIANAATEGYVRRSVNLAEVALAGAYGRIGDISLSGVKVAGLNRNVDMFRQLEVRRTTADASRGQAELTGLENIETTLENSNLFPSLTAFETSLQQLIANPVDPALRSAALERARTLTGTFHLAASGLGDVGNGLRFEASDGVSQVNLLAGELGRVNLQLTRTAAGSSDQSTLLDRRDNLLQQISTFVGISTTFAPDQTVEVRIGAANGPKLVSGGTVGAFAMATAADGTISFTLGGNPVAPTAGSLAGKAQALIAVRDTGAQLDTIADGLIATMNAAQASGVALDGSAGAAMFSGAGAAGIALALASGNQLATAPAGAGAGSRDPANLNAMLNALSSADISGQTDALLFNVSSQVASSRLTGEALDTIASSAKIALDSQAGVDLEQEAVNLVKYQQAFQASSKAIQVAADVIDTLLAIR